MTTTQSASPPSLGARIAESLRTGIPSWLVFAAVIASLFVETLAGAVIVLLWALASRTPWRALGLVRPQSWLRVLALGIALGLLEKFVMKAVVLPLLGAPPVNAAFAHIANDTPQQLAFLAAYVVVGAGFCEELIFRGYLFERLTRLLGAGWAQSVLIVLATAAFFGGLHFQQGTAGIENAAIAGVVSGAIYVLNGRQLWLLVIMHATFDLAAFAMIYFGWERAVAGLFFP